MESLTLRRDSGDTGFTYDQIRPRYPGFPLPLTEAAADRIGRPDTVVVYLKASERGWNRFRAVDGRAEIELRIESTARVFAARCETAKGSDVLGAMTPEEAVAENRRGAVRVDRSALLTLPSVPMVAAGRRDRFFRYRSLGGRWFVDVDREARVLIRDQTEPPETQRQAWAKEPRTQLSLCLDRPWADFCPSGVPLAKAAGEEWQLTGDVSAHLKISPDLRWTYWYHSYQFDHLKSTDGRFALAVLEETPAFVGRTINLPKL